MKCWAALLAWLMLVSVAGAKSNVLILIQPGLGGAEAPGGLRPAGWVLWPLVVYPQGNTALLSLVTGKDWLGDNLDCRFSTLRDGKLRPEDGKAMERWGYFQARRQFLGAEKLYALAGPERSFRETELLLCVEDPRQPVSVLDAGEPWPSGGLAVRDASSWQEVQDLVGRADRALIVGYPPAAARPWTRMWLAGPGWPEGSPVTPGPGMPGVLPARHVLDVLFKPGSFQWEHVSAASREETGRWLETIRDAAPKWLTAFGVVLAAALSVGLFLALRERHSALLPELTLGLMLCPAACVLGGNVAHKVGVASLGPASALSVIGIYSVSKCGQWALGRWVPHVHRLLAPAIVCCLVMTFANPLWSVLSGEFRTAGSFQGGFPGAAFGCWIASITAVSAFLRGTTLLGEWMARIAALSMSAAGFAGIGWWAAGPWPCALAPLVALFVGEGVWRRAWTPVLPIVGALTTPGLMHGIAWEPGGLLTRAWDTDKLNGADYVAFVLSPLFVGTCALVFFFSLIADRFLLHQYRRLVADDTRRVAVLSGGGALALIGLTQPSLLPSALWCAIAGLAILVLEGVEVL